MNTDEHGLVGGWSMLRAALVACYVMRGICFGGYYEFKTFDHQKAFEYLDQVEAAVGTEEFEKVPFELAFAVALPLGRIDKWYLTPQTFLSHVKRAELVRKRFYREKPLTDDEVKSDLLAFRIRYEVSETADWMEKIGTHLDPLVAKATTAEEAASAIFGWMSGNLELMEMALGYKLPLRGDFEAVKVLKDKKGSEIDVAIFGVAALRASGVAARIVYAPALRGEVGGKVWLEYLGEDRVWRPWVPSLACVKGIGGTGCSIDGLGQDVPATKQNATVTHLAEIRKRFGDKIVLVMTRPEEPKEITEQYVDTANLEFKTDGQEVEISLMIFGRQGLMVARGNEVEEMKNERLVRVGRGLVVAAASFGNRSFALLPIKIPAGSDRIAVRAERGGLVLESDSSPDSRSDK
jgi:hypothetical protein